jgi:hypothetical protein
MSIEAVSLVLNQSKATGRAKLVLLGIANHLGDQGAWPSIATLARYANASERSVKRDIQELVSLGELHVELQAAPMKSQYKTNLYWITISSGVTDWVSRGDSSGNSGVTPAGTQNININHKEPKRIPSRISEDYQPTEKLLEWQQKNFPNVDAKLETEKFIDFFLSSSKGVKNDWDAAWRNWIRNSSKPKPWANAVKISRQEQNKKAIQEFLNGKD